MIKYLSGEESIALIEDAVKIGVEPDRKRLHLATKLPFVRPLFFRIFHKMIGTMFNGEAGFRFEEIEYDSRHYRVGCSRVPLCEVLRTARV